MVRVTTARINLEALRSNLQAIRNFLSTESGRNPPGIIAVVKANAYGHGAERVGLALEHAGATMLACADIEEGIALRRAGVQVPVLVFGALSVSDLDGLFEYGLTPTISTPSAARAVQAAAVKARRTIGYHLKIDTSRSTPA
jgi:alanine racemase